MSRALRLLALATLLQGCAALDSVPSQAPARLDILRERHFELPDAKPLNVGEVAVRDGYQDYVQHASSIAWRDEAMKRLADLEVEGVLATQAGPADYRSAIETYQTLLQQIPSGPEREALLYALARAWAQQGEVERQQQVMAQLLREFPDSPFRTELEFRSAEYRFAQHDYQAAITGYEAVLSHQALSPFQEKARYKLAWSLYRNNRQHEAVTRFLEMFRYRMTPQLVADGKTIENLALSEADRQLMQDVVRGVALAASADAEVSLRAHFTHVEDEPYAYLVYAALVERYVEQDRYHDAAETAREFVQRWPTHPAAPRLQLRLLAVIEMGGFAARLEEERAEFATRYHPQGEYWRLLSNEQRVLLTEPLQQTMLELAQHSHGRAQRSHTDSDYQQAIHWYRLFLTGFPEHAEAPHVSYLLGEVLYENHQYDEAAAAYEKCAYHYPRHASSADAGYAALQAYRKHEEELSSGEFRDNWHWLGISSALSFINRFPDEPRSTDLLASTAQELYAMHRYQRAADVARLLLVRQPQPDKAVLRTAWTVLGYSEFELGHFAEAEHAYREVVTMTDARDPQRAQRIEWLAAAIYKQAEQARDSGNPVAAATHFLRVGELVPDTKIRVTADYDAAASMMAAGRWREAIELLLRFRNSYRNSPLQNSVSEKLAVAYMRSGEQHKAAAEFEDIAAKRAEAKEKREALLLAADLYSQVHDDEAQQRLLKRYIREFPSPLEMAIEARYKLALASERRGDSVARDQWYRDMIAANNQLSSEQTVRSRYLAARAQLILAKPQFEAFVQLPLVAPLAQSLQRKKGLMEAALAAYGKVLDYGSAETTTEATWYIAELQRLFGRALLESERPTNLNSEELEQYELMLEERAYPFEENAIKIHRSNIMRISQGIYDEWVKRSMASLAQLQPVRYAKQEQGEGAFRELR